MKSKTAQEHFSHCRNLVRSNYSSLPEDTFNEIFNAGIMALVFAVRDFSLEELNSVIQNIYLIPDINLTRN